MSKTRKILFIVEGENDEPEIIKKLMKICYPKIEYEYSVCQKNIHMLISKMKDKYGNIDEDLDIKKVLQEKETDKEKIKILKDNYTDIILVFDLDPQNNKKEYENIKLLLEYFNDSTEMGKLFINYPAMQSYKHLKENETIIEFCNKKVDILDCSKYKHIANNESDYKQISKYNFDTILHLLNYNIRKINFLLYKKAKLMTEKEYEQLKQVDIFNKELEFLNNNEISVLNTVLLFIVDFKPNDIIRKLRNIL